MPDTTTANLAYVKPEPGASRSTWGNKTNDNWDKSDAVFAPDGTGISVGLHIGTGKKLAVDGEIALSGTFTVSGAGAIPGSALAADSVVAGKMTFTQTDRVLGRAAAGAGAGEEIPCTSVGRALLAATDAAAIAAAIGAPSLAGTNVFTGNNTFQLEDDGTGIGPNLVLERVSATPQPNDGLGAVPFVGRNSELESTLYAMVYGLIKTPTAGVEEGIGVLQAIVAGVVQDAFSWAKGFYAAGLDDKGVGTVNAKDYFKNGVALDTTPVGAVVDTSYAFESASDTTSSQIPADNTIPQSDEGKQFLTVTHTPKSATNKLKIDVIVQVENSGNSSITAALFRDAQAGALAANGVALSQDRGATICLTHYMTAPGVAAVVFKVRAGCSSSHTCRFNPNSYGGRSCSSITVTEIKA